MSGTDVAHRGSTGMSGAEMGCSTMCGSVVLTEGMRLPGTARGTVAWEDDRASAHDRDRSRVAAERAGRDPGGMLHPYLAAVLLFVAAVLL
eukprot:3673456-Rhodomonas_salina.2